MKPKSSLYNKIIENVVFKGGDLLLRTDFIDQLQAQRALSALQSNELQEVQLRKLNNMLHFATEKTNYYAGLKTIRKDDPETWLQQFPLLTKPVLRANTEAMLSAPKSSLICYPTSGSSGIQTEIYIDKKEESLLRAILINWWEWTGYYLGKPMLQTGMSPSRGFVKSLKDKLTRTEYFIAFGLGEKEILDALRKLEGRNGYHFGGYASSLYVIAETARKHNIQLKFDAAISWGDKMFAHYKKSIEEVFHTTVFENYGLNEGFMVGQKKDLPYFYTYTPNVYVEILDDEGQPVPDGEMGHVVLTKLDGYAMPLIRYTTGDLAVKLPKHQYPTNRDLAFPLLEKVVGRDTDIVRTPEGGTLIVHTFTGIFEFYKEIRQFKIVQHQLDSILVEYIPSEYFNAAALDKIAFEIRDKGNTAIQIDFKEVSDIPPTRSGKPQIIESSLSGNVFSPNLTPSA